VFGLRDHTRLPDGRRVWSTGGTLHVDGTATDTGNAGLEQLAPGDGTVTALVRSAERPATIVRFGADDPTRHDVVVDHPPLPLADGDISRPQHIEYPTAGGATAYGWYYPPVNSTVTAPADGAPPLVVMIHGGPTSGARPWFSLAYQFWTTRGFAIVDVDHRGSTGYGTEYRNLLDGNWGVVDVEDCVAAAEHLATAGLADPDRIVIRGGSAGGFTVLGALSQSDTFAAGACSYGIADLSVLAADTHKFESRYPDRLIGPWPEARDVYEQRSPINHLDRFNRPLIVFQGLDDKVVPPNQSEMIVAALRGRDVECEYHAYEGEGHGFRRADTIVHQMNAELAFYQRVLRLERDIGYPTPDVPGVTSPEGRR
jgi:dipeptidyl aminopeptidase/acylaminoacyl peptidase